MPKPAPPSPAPAPAPIRRPGLAAAGRWAVVLALLLYANDHVAQLMWIRGPSMAPALNAEYHEAGRRDVVLVRLWTPWRGVRRGSVVTFWSPSNPENMVVKRVLALEGDEVRTRAPYPFATAVVPPGQVWVEGDNAEARKTLDSNTYGPVPASLIVGQVVAVVWPWRKAGLLSWQDYKDSPRVWKGKHAVTRAEVG